MGRMHLQNLELGQHRLQKEIRRCDSCKNNVSFCKAISPVKSSKRVGGAIGDRVIFQRPKINVFFDNSSGGA